MYVRMCMAGFIRSPIIICAMYTVRILYIFIYYVCIVHISHPYKVKITDIIPLHIIILFIIYMYSARDSSLRKTYI